MSRGVAINVSQCFLGSEALNKLTTIVSADVPLTFDWIITLCATAHCLGRSAIKNLASTEETRSRNDHWSQPMILDDPPIKEVILVILNDETQIRCRK